MKRNDLVWLLLISLSLFAACKKNAAAKTEFEKLPPVTQTGANTFGCLVNGQVYVPKGHNGTGTPNPKTSVQFFNGNMVFSINSNQLDNNGNSLGFLDISFSDSLLSSGFYTYPSKLNFSIGWPKVLNNCFTPAFDTTVKKWGTGVITKFDNINKIISGNFNGKFKTQLCDTVFISNGQFDFKF